MKQVVEAGPNNELGERIRNYDCSKKEERGGFLRLLRRTVQAITFIARLQWSRGKVVPA